MRYRGRLRHRMPIAAQVSTRSDFGPSIYPRSHPLFAFPFGSRATPLRRIAPKTCVVCSVRFCQRSVYRAVYCCFITWPCPGFYVSWLEGEGPLPGAFSSFPASSCSVIPPLLSTHPSLTKTENIVFPPHSPRLLECYSSYNSTNHAAAAPYVCDHRSWQNPSAWPLCPFSFPFSNPTPIEASALLREPQLPHPPVGLAFWGIPSFIHIHLDPR